MIAKSLRPGALPRAEREGHGGTLVVAPAWPKFAGLRASAASWQRQNSKREGPKSVPATMVAARAATVDVDLLSDDSYLTGPALLRQVLGRQILGKMAGAPADALKKLVGGVRRRLPALAEKPRGRAREGHTRPGQAVGSLAPAGTLKCWLESHSAKPSACSCMYKTKRSGPVYTPGVLLPSPLRNAEACLHASRTLLHTCQTSPNTGSIHTPVPRSIAPSTIFSPMHAQHPTTCVPPRPSPAPTSSKAKPNTVSHHHNLNPTTTSRTISAGRLPVAVAATARVLPGAGGGAGVSGGGRGRPRGGTAAAPGAGGGLQRLAQLGGWVVQQPALGGRPGLDVVRASGSVTGVGKSGGQLAATFLTHRMREALSYARRSSSICG